MNDNNQPIGILIQELEELQSGKQSMNYYLMKNYILLKFNALMD
jgi:hypothetical protein